MQDKKENIKTFYILSNNSVHFCDQDHFSQQLETFFEIATHIWKIKKTHYWEHETN